MYAAEKPELFELFLEQAPWAIAMLDRQMRYLLASGQWFTQWGVTPQDIIGRCHYEIFFHKPIDPAIAIPFQQTPIAQWQEIQTAGLAGAVQTWEAEFITADHSRMRVQWESRPWRTATGEIGGLMLSSRCFSATVHPASSLVASPEQARLNELQLRKQSEVLVELARSQTQKSGNIYAALREIAAAAANTLEVDRVTLWLFDAHEITKVVFADSELKNGLSWARQRSLASLQCVELYERQFNRHSQGMQLNGAEFPAYLHALETERAIATHDATADPRTQELSHSYLNPLGIKGMIDVPIRIGGELVGCLCCEMGTPRRWQLGEQNFAASIGDYAALALEACDRAHTQAKLQAANDQLQAVLDAVPGCISWFSADGTYLGVNGYLANTFKRSPEDFIGQPIGFLDGSPEFNNLVPQFFTHPAKEDRHEIEVKLQGSSVHFLVVAHKYNAGQAAVFVGFDITQRKRAEAALQQANEELELRVEKRTADLQQALSDLNKVVSELEAEIDRRQQVEEVRNVLEFSINHAADAVFWLTPQAEFFYVNDAACLTLNYSRTELLSLTLHDINPDIPRELWPDYWEEIKQFGSMRLESKHQRKNGDTFPVEITINYFRVQGNEYNCIFARDISERSRIEKELYQAKAIAEAASRAKMAFLANMSHDLRTPLTTIISYSQLLQEDVQQSRLETQELISELQAINVAGKELITLIDDIITLSKIELNQIDFSLNFFAVSQLIEDLYPLIHSQLEQSRNSLEIECADDIGQMYADRAKVQQILLNLVGYLLKSSHQGTISLTVCREENPDFRAIASLATSAALAHQKIENWICFCIASSTHRLTAEQLQNIFQAFPEPNHQPQRDRGSTGLGLAIGRSFCQMMGGDVIAESEIEEGTRFSIYLPADVSEVQPEFFLLSHSPKVTHLLEKPEPIPLEKFDNDFPETEMWSFDEAANNEAAWLFDTNFDDTESEV